MADQPPGAHAGEPKPGTPEYDWLYGTKQPDASAEESRSDDATRRVPRQPRPDETRVMPVVPREQNPAQARGIAADRASRRMPPRVPPPPAPPSGPARLGRMLGGFGRRFRLRYLFILLVLWIVFLVAVPFFAWSKVDKVDAFPSGNRPSEQPGTTYLLVGSDSRKGLTAAQRKQLHTGNDAGQRTDTIVLVHTGSGPSLTMSIPRDTIVPVPGHGTTKINAAFAYGGPKLLVQTIEQVTGIRIDHYAEIGFGGFVNVVDSVGGITICPSHNMDDKLANLHVKKGCQHADGRVALAYARSRHADPKLGDIARGGQQREVMSAVGHKALSPWTFINPFRYWSFWTSTTDSLTVDKDMGVVPMGHLGWAMTHSKLNCVVPISDLAVHLDPTRSKEMFKDIINDDTSAIGKSLCTKSGLPAGVG
jgi:LCP family protein required for cell wall assembly